MSFRIVMIENNISLSVKLNNVIAKGADKEMWIPLDDISAVVIDNLQISITARMMSTFAEKGITVIICDQKHLPIGLYYPYSNNSRSSKIIRTQTEKENSFYNKIWKSIIVSKIENQCQVLKLLELSDVVQTELERLKNEVVEGDPTNREAHAAKIYFNCLMDTTFSRGNEDILLNSGLDYGYAIIRAYIARLCVAYGLCVSIGVQHKSEYNHFNLVDDLLEPMRPFVDFYAYKLLSNEELFKAEHRRKIVNILNHKVIYNNKKMYVCSMLEEYVEQFSGMIMGRRDNVEYPNITKYLGEDDEI